MGKFDGTFLLDLKDRISSGRSRTYTINQVGSSVCTYPSDLAVGDVLRFNITNTDITTKYTGTLLTYTFPENCTVAMYAYGARGGMGNQCTISDVGYGAMASAVYEFKEGDTLLICVGQAGTDYVGSASDGTTGAGGGGTFITLKTTDGSGDTFNGTEVGNGWKVKPILIASGGNGGRDIGYSSSGTIYHGQGFGGSSPGYDVYSGGGYSLGSTSSYSGATFLAGAKGTSYSYTRGSTSYSGFGCGGGNTDDKDGGGGGGYHGGRRGSTSAYSYASPDCIASESSSGANAGEGYIDMVVLEDGGASVDIFVKGQWKTSQAMYVNVDGEWKKAKELYVNVDGEWKKK